MAASLNHWLLCLLMRAGKSLLVSSLPLKLTSRPPYSYIAATER